MDYQGLSQFVMNNLMFIVAGLGVLVIIMYAIIIHLYLNLSDMKRRYRRMMTGTDGANIEKMLFEITDELKQTKQENQRLDLENQRLDALAKKSLTRVAVVRFRAFDNMGGDLSYAVAMLDAHNNGVVFSSIFDRDASRSYAKPIESGKSSYKLTEEEQQALAEAMSQEQQ